MLLIYREATGEVVENTGTNSLLPEGPPGDMAWANQRDRTGLALLRLHDVIDASLIQQMAVREYSVQGGRIVFGTMQAPSAPPPPPLEEVVKKVAALQEWAAQVQAQVDAATELLMGGLT